MCVSVSVSVRAERKVVYSKHLWLARFRTGNDMYEGSGVQVQVRGSGFSDIQSRSKLGNI